jgi:hypothetical protein
VTQPTTPRPCTSAALAAAALLLVWAIAGCADVERCGVPGVVGPCACADGKQGARVCQAEKTWRACDCSGAIALPNPVRERQGGSGGAGGTGGSGGPAASGAGGTAPPADAAMPPGDDDGGAEPAGGAGGSAGEAGGGSGSGGAAGGDAGTIDPALAYRGCMTAADCDPGARCVITAGFPSDDSVCQPACVDVADCPVPEGDYMAEPECVTGFCRLDCTPVLFEPLHTCPEGMQCIATQLTLAFCHDGTGM